MFIEELPTEVFQLIIEFLIEEDETDLRSVAQASSFCYAMALPYLYRTITVNLKSLDDLKGQVQAKKRALQSHEIYDSVRTIIVDDKMTKTETASPVAPTLSPLPAPPLVFISSDMAAKATEKTALDWQTLAALLRRLPAIQDFIFACCRPFPLSVLLALHRYHRNCRLHIKFLQWGSGGHRRSSAEFELAHSPCLFSITADDSKIKLVQMFMRLAPNLREVNLMSSNAFLSIRRPSRFLRFSNLVEPPRWGLEPSGNVPKKASLRSLRIYSLFGLNDLETWDRTTQFSLLEYLTLEGHIVNELLTHITTKIPLPSLKTLKINVWATTRPTPMAAGIDSRMEGLLGSVPPLESLTLGSYFWRSTLKLDFVVHHGSRLQELNLHLSRGNGLELNELKKIAAHCPLLRHMELTLHRTWGNKTEVELYRALGSIPHLQTLSLALDLTVDIDVRGFPLDGTALVKGDKQLLSYGFEGEQRHVISKGTLRLMLMSTAFDEALARAIFLEISAGKPIRSKPLEKLMVWPAVYGLSNSVHDLRSLDTLLRWMGRPWHVSRTTREHYQPELSVKKCYWPGLHEDEAPPLPPYLEHLWYNLWPPENSENPVENWSSFPLASLESLHPLPRPVDLITFSSYQLPQI